MNSANNFSWELSDILLYLDLIKKTKKKPSYQEMELILYFLKNYEEVKVFYERFTELEIKMPKYFEAQTLIHFIEDLDDTYKLKETIIAKRDRRKKSYYSSLFIQQIFLSKTREQAIQIWSELKKYENDLGEIWVDRFNSHWRIKKDMEAWRKHIQTTKLEYFPQMFEEYCQLKNEYFAELSLPLLKQKILKSEGLNEENRKERIDSTYRRSVLLKEFARRIANGICQLCEKKAPFLDKQGNPFLEVHHIHYLSNGGNDSIDNVIALCPNCHRRIHQLELEDDIKKIKEKAVENMNI